MCGVKQAFLFPEEVISDENFSLLGTPLKSFALNTVVLLVQNDPLPVP